MQPDDSILSDPLVTLDIRVEHRGDVPVLVVSGELDLATSPQLAESIDYALDSAPPALVVDLGNVVFLATSAMSVLMSTQERLQGSGTSRLLVVADGPATSRPLRLVGVDGVLDIYTDVDSAVTAAARRD